jgi:anaphase-promoting complex subunit 3
MSYEERDEAESQLLGLYNKIGEGCYALSRYDCDHALNVFKSLPPSQANTPYVLSRSARAYYESRNLTEVRSILSFIDVRHVRNSSLFAE